MDLQLTFEQVESEVRRLVAENPDHIYQTGDLIAGSTINCYYSADSPGSQEACLFGQAFANLGCPDEWLRDREGSPAVDLANVLMARYADGREDTWMCDLQGRQDRGVPWGTALSMTDEAMPLR